MLALATLAAAGTLAQGSSVPPLAVDVRMGGREVRVEIPEGGFDPLPGAAVLSDGGWRYLLGEDGLPFARVADRGGWSDLAELYRRAQQKAVTDPAVWRVKAFVFRRWDDLVETEAMLVQRRATLEPSRLQFALHSLGRLAVAAEAFSGGRIRLALDMEVEEPAVDAAFLQKEAGRFVAARTNRGTFDAEDRVFRGPYDQVLLIVPRPGGAQEPAVRVPGASVVRVADEAEPGEDSRLLRDLLEAWAAKLGEATEAHGWASVSFASLTVDTPAGPHSELPALLALGPFARCLPSAPPTTEAYLANLAGDWPLAGAGLRPGEGHEVPWCSVALAAAHSDSFPGLRVVAAKGARAVVTGDGGLRDWIAAARPQPNGGPAGLPVRAAEVRPPAEPAPEPSKEPEAPPAARAAYAWRIARTGEAQPGDAALLTRWLAERDDTLRLNACRALQRVPTPEALPQLTALLVEFNPRVADEAVKAIAAIGTPDATEALRRGAMFGRYDHTREACARELGRTGDPKHASAISTLLSTRSWRSRAVGASALSRLRDPMAQMMALAYLNDVDPMVRLAVVEGVDPGMDQVCRRLLWLSVNDPSDEVRARSMLRLMASGKPEFQNEGVKGVRDESRGVRLALAQALAEVPESLHVRVARYLLSDSDPTVRAAAAAVAPAQALESAWKDPDPRVQLALARRAKAEGLDVPADVREGWSRSPDPRVVEAVR